MQMKAGRPRSGETRPELVQVGFKADAETLDAIAVLTAAESAPGVVAAKSAAIRKGLIAAARLLQEKESLTKIEPIKTR